MELLERLIEAFGPSGKEDKVKEIIKKEIKPYVDEIYIDNLGNLIAHKKGESPRIMLAAHMDEIGLMIKKIDDKGRIRCSLIGDLDPLTLLGEIVDVKTKKGSIRGVITIKEMSDALPFPEKIRIGDIFVDTGVSKKELNKLGVQVGTYLFLVKEFGNLAAKDIFYGKALDDRIGCFILIELAKKLRKVKNEMYYVFTVQEEIGLYGAITSAYRIEPDWAISVDVVDSDDFSETPSKKMGEGPCLVIKDAAMVTNEHLNDLLINVAKKKKIPLQLDVTDYGVTDALNISVSKGGVPSTIIAVPIRNIHTTVSMAHKKDINNTIKLLTEFLKNAPKFTMV